MARKTYPVQRKAPALDHRRVGSPAAAEVHSVHGLLAYICCRCWNVCVGNARTKCLLKPSVVLPDHITNEPASA